MASYKVFMVSKPAAADGQEFDNVDDLFVDKIKEAESKFVVPREFNVESIIVEREINKIPYMELRLIDSKGKVATSSPDHLDNAVHPNQNFSSDQYAVNDNNSPGWFDLGRRVAVKVDNDGAVLIFKGVVVEQKVTVNADKRSYFVVLKHPAVRHTVNRRSKLHGGTINVDAKISSNEVFHQSAASDWDFVVSMADLYQRWVVFDDLKVAFLKETDDKRPLAEDFSLNHTFKTTKYLNDDRTVKLADNDNSSVGVVSLEKLDNAGPNNEEVDIREKLILGREKDKITVNEVDFNNRLSKVYGRAVLYSPVFEPIEQKLGQEFIAPLEFINGRTTEFHQSNPFASQAQLLAAKNFKVKYGFSAGRVRVSNKYLVDAGNYRTLEESEEANKIVLGMDILGILTKVQLYRTDPRTLIRHTKVTRIRHEITNEGWFTDLFWGSNPDFHMTKNPDGNSPPAFGVMPATNSLQAAVVTADSSDTEKFVKVQLFQSNEEQDANNELQYDPSIEVSIPKLSSIDPSVEDNVAVNGNRLNYFSCKAEDVLLIGYLNQNPQDAFAIGIISSGKVVQNEDDAEQGPNQIQLNFQVNGPENNEEGNNENKEQKQFEENLEEKILDKVVKQMSKYVPA